MDRHLTAHTFDAAATVGNLAAHLPGAAALFHSERISFCRRPERTLAEAAAWRQVKAGAPLDWLSGLVDDATRSTPKDTASLIHHIAGCCYEGYGGA